MLTFMYSSVEIDLGLLKGFDPARRRKKGVTLMPRLRRYRFKNRGKY